MSSTTQYNMAPFSFPDPAVSPTVVNPNTGDTWKFEDGVWMLADPDDPDGAIAAANPPTFDVTIGALRSEISTLRADIIQLRAQLTAATVNNFLILE